MRVAFDKNKRVVVYAVDGHHPLSRENLLFEKNNDEGRQISPFLYEKCLERGIQLVTPDIYFSWPDRPASVPFFMDGITSEITRELIAANLRPAIIMIVETPIYLAQFFYNLERETEIFDHAFLPKGAASHVSPKTNFHPYLPSQRFHGDERIESNFEKKKFLSLIASNNRVHFLRRWYVHVMNMIKPFPSFVDRELYRDRLEAIKYFSRDPDFDLYGHGWDRPVRYGNAKYQEAIQHSYRGKVQDKIPTLSRYKFSICFENSIFDGYVTEKMIDAFFAGCVPIYWGAPDVLSYIPEGCFIDFRKFKTYQELDAFLKNMKKEEYDGYIQNIQKFILSENYQRYFGKEKFANDVIKILESYF